jgi:hypothetical protein
MRRSPVRFRLALTLTTLLLLAACSGGGSTPVVVNQSITPCYGEGTPAVIEPAFDVWQASFEPLTPRPTPTSMTPTAGTPGAPTPTAPTAATRTATSIPTPQNILAVSVDTVNAASASEFRLTVACQGTVVIPSTIDGMACTFPPPPLMPGDMPQCPSARVDLNDFGFGNLRRVGCLIEIGPTQPLDVGVGMCNDPTHTDYRLNVKLSNQPALSLTLPAHNCRATQSCLQEVFGINVGN